MFLTTSKKKYQVQTGEPIKAAFGDSCKFPERIKGKTYYKITLKES